MNRLLSSLLFGGLTLVACSRSPEEPSARAEPKPLKQSNSLKAPNRASSAPTGSPTEPDEADTNGAKYRHPARARVVAIGDLHGDLRATRRALLLAGAMDEADQWTGGELVVVQTGDQLDRGDDEAQILDLLDRLQTQAALQGGALLVLNGNHETMNVLGDFRYVTAHAMHDIDEVQPRSAQAGSFSAAYQGRAGAFLPGGGIALKLAERPLIVMVGDTAFVHGGVLPAHVNYGIDRLNDETGAWMRGERSTPPPLVVDPDGPLWTRLYGDPQLTASVCAILESTLKLLGAKRLVVGHTVQQHGLSSACSDRVFRIDVGLARYYGDHPVQVLEVTAQGTKILTAP
jgi:hypothetical protein